MFAMQLSRNHQKQVMTSLTLFPRVGAAAGNLKHSARLMLALAAAVAAQRALAAGPVYQQTNLTSDVPGAAKFTDSHLIAAWGAVHSPTSGWWVASPLGGVAAVYNGEGQP